MKPPLVAAIMVLQFATKPMSPFAAASFLLPTTQRRYASTMLVDPLERLRSQSLAAAQFSGGIYSRLRLGRAPLIPPHEVRWNQRAGVHLPPRSQQSSALASSPETQGRNSVTGPIYEEGDNHPKVKLFTKEGCTLCDKVKGVLESVKEQQPHSLYAVDITDEDKADWFSKYKYDIPVLHFETKAGKGFVYWAKHELAIEDALADIEEARRGDFQERQGEPDASRLERK